MSNQKNRAEEARDQLAFRLTLQRIAGYHCPTGHPGFSRVYDIPSYVINNESSFSVHNVGYRDQSQGKQPQFKAELPDRFPADILELYEKIYTVPHKFLETLPTKAELTGNKADADKGQEFATDQPGIFVYGGWARRKPVGSVADRDR